MQANVDFSYLRDTLVSGHIKDGMHPDDTAGQARINKASVEVDKQLLILTQTACKAEKLEQALEAARLMSLPGTLDAAIKLAAFFHLPGLQERIGLIKEARLGESAIDRERRDSKWGYLVDNRTIVDSTIQVSDYASALRGKAANTYASLSKPLETGFQKRSLGDGSALGSKPIAATKLTKRNDSGHGSSEQDYEMVSAAEDQSVDQQEEDLYADETQDASMVDETPVPAAIKPARPHNPFAKTAMAVATPPTSSNPFAKKSGASGKTADLKRSASFFDRVEGTVPASKGASLLYVIQIGTDLFVRQRKESCRQRGRATIYALWTCTTCRRSHKEVKQRQEAQVCS